MQDPSTTTSVSHTLQAAPESSEQAGDNVGNNTPSHVYFPGLNALRVYAALSVVIVHIGHNFADLRTQPAYYPLVDSLFLDGPSAVNLFLVLSGFLITYLLLYERARTGTILVSRFYARRILRIWPLYYLIAFIGLVALPALLGPTYILNDFPVQKTVLVLLLLPSLINVPGPLLHLWSISLEEQFYLVWPWVLQSTGMFLRVCFGILIIKIAIAPVVTAFHSEAIENLFLTLRFECMAIGALGAYLYFHKHRLLRWIYSPLAQGCAIVAFVVLVLVHIPLTLMGSLGTSVLFIVLILNVATNERSWIRLEHRAFNALGQMSYGIYMYHYPLLYVLVFTLNANGLRDGDLYNLILYTVTIAGTLLLASASYRWFESPFLRSKTRFAIVQTRR